MSITHNNPIVNPQSKPTRLAPGKINPNDAKMAALCFTIAALACCISLGVIQPILSICVIAGVVPMAKLAPETGGPEAPKAAGYFAFPIGLSDCEYVGKIQTEPPPPTPNLGRKKVFKPPAIIGIEVYASTVITRRYGRIGAGNTQRQEIKNLSADSLGNLAFIAFNTPAYFPSMLTLTYPAKFSNDGKQVKDNLDNFLYWYRYHFPGEKYLWFLEFQKRGAPHFHVLSTVDLAAFGKLATIKRKNKAPWQTHWDTWQTQQEAWQKLGGGKTAWEVINDAEGGKKYAAKYATKAYQKAVPPAYRNVGRFWGHSREGVKPEPDGSYACSEEQLKLALERGGWEHLPDDADLVYRELFQAAQAIDLSLLTPVETLDRPKVEPARPILPADWPQPARSGGYLCQNCYATLPTWAGQCPACGEWHTLTLQQEKTRCSANTSTTV